MHLKLGQQASLFGFANFGPSPQTCMAVNFAIMAIFQKAGQANGNLRFYLTKVAWNRMALCIGAVP